MPTKLGQNFLKDPAIVKKILDLAILHPDDSVIEIGPGGGILTCELAKYVKKIIAIEIDNVLAKKIKLKFEKDSRISLINADILKINLNELVLSYGLQIASYKVVANLPYYITSPIIRLFLEAEIKPKEMILMVQKEVAERIVAKPGKMSILAVSVQYYANPAILFEVPKEAFSPIPKVDSAIIKIANISQKNISKTETTKFFRVVRAGFCAKRKTLINNLASSLQLDKKTLEKKIKKLNLSLDVRAQQLSLEKWKELANIL